MRKEEGALNEVLAELHDAAVEGDGATVRVGDLIDAIDERGYGPALAVLPLIELSPLGGIPGFPSILALTLALITVRLLTGYDHFWAPDWVRKRKIDSRKVEKSLDWLKPIALRIDAKLHERLSSLAGRRVIRVVCIVILGLLLTVPPLELVPFATSGPMIVIAIFGLAILFKDGLLMSIGFTGAVIAIAGGFWGLVASGVGG